MNLIRTAHTVVKAYRHGAHRACAPQDTIDRIRPHFAKFGITRVANLTGLDRIGLPVIMVCRPNARSSAIFHGKGVDLASAKASGLMEAVETWHAEQVELPLRFAGAAVLARTCPIADVERLPQLLGRRFEPDLPILWVMGHDLASGERVWLPFELVHMHATISGPQGSGCLAASTNGLASGNHLLEAISHALCEVIERDAISLWNQCPAAAQDNTRVDIATIGDETCGEVLDLFSGANLDVAVWNVTTEVGVPAFQCQLMDRHSPQSHVGVGAGCHPVREIALLRALTEAAQVRTTYIVGSREDIEDRDYDCATLAARHTHAMARMARTREAQSYEAIGRFEFDTFDAEVEWIVDRLSSAGFPQAIAVDLTMAEFGIPVVRVVVPGLEGSDHHPGYAPGARALLVRRQ